MPDRSDSLSAAERISGWRKVGRYALLAFVQFRSLEKRVHYGG